MPGWAALQLRDARFGRCCPLWFISLLARRRLPLAVGRSGSSCAWQSRQRPRPDAKLAGRPLGLYVSSAVSFGAYRTREGVGEASHASRAHPAEASRQPRAAASNAARGCPTATTVRSSSRHAVASLINTTAAAVRDRTRLPQIRQGLPPTPVDDGLLRHPELREMGFVRMLFG